jgi:predicted component of type VI protein secretion system
MAYIVYFYKDQELGRLKLEGDVSIGRSADCAISIRDILLSRHHSSIKQANGHWFITDEGSKNGTRIGGQVIDRQALEDGDVIRMGKSTLRFFEGDFVPSTTPAPAGSQRPADPFEALSGTISAFEYQPRGPVRSTENLPTPRPGPQEPASYGEENVRGLVAELVSSSWDSIYEEARRNEAEAPQSPLIDSVRRRRSPQVDLGLQVHAGQSEAARDRKLSPEGPAPTGVLEAPPAPGRIRSWFRKLGRLFH